MNYFTMSSAVKFYPECLVLKYFFSEKIRLNILCEFSAKQTIHMMCQGLFSRKILKNIMSTAAVCAVFGQNHLNPCYAK